MQLDERKTKILQAIIRNYLETGEPVGSRTISKYTDLNLSSATIRNEMADLEEMGFILQPHTSAGRIPSDAGYRFYVDMMMQEKEKEVAELKELLIEKEDKLDLLLKQTAKLLAVNTNYATMVSAPRINANKLKFIQLSRVNKRQILAVIVTEGNMIKNSILPIDEVLTDETLLKLNILLNTHLNGLSIEEINLPLISTLKKQAGIHSEIVSEVIDAVAEAIKGDEELEIYTSGTNNIFRYPELADHQRASELISTFEEKKELTELVRERLSDEESTGIQVYIGKESKMQTMEDCSIVTATYDLGEGMKGTIGIIGPKRMDYDKVIDNIKNVKKQLDSIYKKEQERKETKVQENLNEEVMQEEAEETTAEAVEETCEECETESCEAEVETEGTVEETEEEATEENTEEKEGKGFFGKKKDKKVAALEEKVAELEDRTKRQMAEFENFRKRTEKEKSMMFETGAKSVIEKILPVIDNFERGLAAIEPDNKDSFYEGMVMIHKQMLSELEKIGVTPIEAVGKEFDPNFHNAVMQVESEEFESGIVAQELQKGYMYRESVVRYSMVAVVS